MRKSIFSILWIVLSVVGAGVYAQQTPLAPIQTLEAGDFRALAITVDGNRLLAADGETQQVRIYDFSDPANPELLSSVDVGGTPVALAGGEDFALAAVITGGDLDTIEVIASALGVQYMSGVNYVDVPLNPRILKRSADNHWGIAISDDAYTLLEINAPDDISSFQVDETLIDAALSNTTAYILHGRVLGMAPLQSGGGLSAEQTLSLDGTPSLVALNARVTMGVVVLDDNRLVFFDPSSLEVTGGFVMRGAAISGVSFVTRRSGDSLVLSQEGSATITMLNVSDPQNAAVVSSSERLDNPIRALITYNQFIVATDGVTISIFAS
jgi:hypothetical protein